MQWPNVNSLRPLALVLGWLATLPLLAQLSDSFAPPANDSFADATEVAGVPLTLEADLAFATAEPFEALPYLGYTAWWRWTATTRARPRRR